MKRLLKVRWLIAAIWLAAVVFLAISRPDVGTLVREKGQPKIPDNYSSVQAKHLLNKFNDHAKSAKSMDVIVVFHEKKKMTSEQIDNVKEQVQKLKKDGDELGVIRNLNSFDQPESKNQLVSKDGTTIMDVLTVDKKDRSTNEVREDFEKELKGSDVPVYLTGNELINEDQIKTSQSGVKKTESITIILIIVILIIVFRSPITPIISLLTVGVSYIVSFILVTLLVKYMDFPFSSITQTFMILVLFGIGTDYNILLLSRYKEELSKGGGKLDAISATYRTAGKTVFFSGLAVLVGFSILVLAEFSIFRAATAVAIGVLILIVTLYSLLPIFMSIMGKWMFWPMKEARGHSENRLWGALGRFSLRRPFISIIVILLLAVPIILNYQNALSFNSLKEVDPSYESVKGFDILSDAFSPGKAMPLTVVVSSEKKMDSNDRLSDIDELTQKISEVDGVSKVYGPTRPKGEKIEQFYIQDQLGSIDQGLDKSNKGIEDISNGWKDVQKQLSSSSSDNPNAGIDKLVKSTSDMTDNLHAVSGALEKVNNGIASGAQGAEQIQGALGQLAQKSNELNDSTIQLLSSYRKLQSGYSELSTRYASFQSQFSTLKNISGQMQNSIAALKSGHPELQNDPNMRSLESNAKQLGMLSDKMAGAMKQLNTQMNTLNQSFKKADEGLTALTNGQEELSKANAKIQESSGELANGLKSGSNGQKQIVQNLGKMENGLVQINNGQKQLQDKLSGLSSQMQGLDQGLTKSIDGLNQVSSGLESTSDYFKEVEKKNVTSSVFYVPEDAKNGDFQKSLDAYMTKDRKDFKLTVELTKDPYSKEAIHVVDNIQKELNQELDSSHLKGSKTGIGGVSSINRDLDSMSSKDFSRTVMLMLIGIFLILIIILRRFWIPVFIIISLVGSYFTAISITEWIIVSLTGKEGLSWTVPFFAFIMIVALGVDYSIFLMLRYKEHENMPPKEGLLLAMKRIGGVVISAAIILCGTFAAVYPSGVPALVQIASIVIIALLLLAFGCLPIFIPALMAIQLKWTRSDTRMEDRGK
ncbi:MMPL family transporter [Falsibacillus albus]|uniref:MMPL family transporter n=1 Tax=Falsibacillus albus TaxID=2478915 RepID=UPI001314B55B|nr:MMPL family transporter [Falsibacillus albus]